MRQYIRLFDFCLRLLVGYHCIVFLFWNSQRFDGRDGVASRAHTCYLAGCRISSEVARPQRWRTWCGWSIEAHYTKTGIVMVKYELTFRSKVIIYLLSLGYIIQVLIAVHLDHAIRSFHSQSYCIYLVNWCIMKLSFFRFPGTPSLLWSATCEIRVPIFPEKLIW